MITLTPSPAKTIALKNKPAIVTLAKNAIVFNPRATQLLALGVGRRFLFEEREGKLYLKYSSDENSWEIKTIVKDCARINTSMLYAAVKHILKSAEQKALRFDVGEFKEGLWPLQLIK